jgi:hypothetical protein
MLQQHRAKSMEAGKSIRPTDNDVRQVPFLANLTLIGNGCFLDETGYIQSIMILLKHAENFT